MTSLQYAQCILVVRWHLSDTTSQFTMMNNQMESKEDEDMNTGTSTTSLLEPQKNENNSMEIPFCGCLSVQFYQPYFDVDTSDVQNRLQQALIFCGRQETFMTFVGTKPDVYGPFWIATTLVFTLSVSANMHGWLQSWLNGNDLWYVY